MLTTRGSSLISLLTYKAARPSQYRDLLPVDHCLLSLLAAHSKQAFKMKPSVATLLATVSLVYAQTATEKEPSLSAIESAAASIQPYSPVSNVEGVAFNRFFQVWLENIVCDHLTNQRILFKADLRRITRMLRRMRT